jgi:hypothetical protein
MGPRPARAARLIPPPLMIEDGNMTLIEAAMASPHCVVSVMGDHAGESTDEIFQRKEKDIERVGKTFWLVRSPKARPLQVQELCKTDTVVYMIFIAPAAKGGASPTTSANPAREYSDDRVIWHRFPSDLSPVTGKLGAGASALVFDTLSRNVPGTLDLWGYAEALDTKKPLTFILGCSTVCAIRKDTSSYPEKLKSRYREIVAVARVVDPYCVWLR